MAEKKKRRGRWERKRRMIMTNRESMRKNMRKEEQEVRMADAEFHSIGTFISKHTLN